MPYIHETEDWPELIWDGDALATPLATVRHKQGRLLGKMEILGFDLRAEAGLVVLTNDVVQIVSTACRRKSRQNARSTIKSWRSPSVAT